MTFVNFNWSMEHGVADVFMPACLCSSPDDARHSINGEVLVLQPYKMIEQSLKIVFLGNISHCEVRSVARTVVSVRASETDWPLLECVSWFLYDFLKTSFLLVSERHPTNFKRGCRGDTL